MKLLFITHKVHELDDDLAFATLWAEEFNRQGFRLRLYQLHPSGRGLARWTLHIAPFAQTQ